MSDGPLLAAEHPHEYELDDVGVEEEELGAAVSLGAGDGLHGGGGGGGGVGEEDVFEGAELWWVRDVSLAGREGGREGGG